MERKLVSAIIVGCAILSLILGSVAPTVADCSGGSCSTGTYTTYTIPEMWYQSQYSQQVVHKISAEVDILSESGKQWNGIGTFDISVDDSKLGTLTSGQLGTAQVDAGKCIITYVGEYYSGYTVKTNTDCQNVKSKHKVEVGVQGLAVNSGDNACPAVDGKSCFYDPGTQDIRYYLVSDKIQAKSDGETAQFTFKIEFRWTFGTFDQNNNPIDLLGNDLGFYKSDRSGPFASGSELLKDGTVFNVGWTDSPAVEAMPHDTRYVYDHMAVDGQNAGTVTEVTMDSPKETFAIWQRQYYLTVDSNCITSGGTAFQCGNPTGSGYYNEDSTATFSADPTVRDPGWMGSFGGFYQFDRWTVDSAGTAPSWTITMNSVKHVVATYIYNDSAAIQNIAIAVSLGLVPVGVLIWVMTHRPGRRGRRADQPPPLPPLIPVGPGPGRDGVPLGVTGFGGPYGTASTAATGFTTGPVPLTDRPLPPGLGGQGGVGAAGAATSGPGTGNAGVSTTGGSGSGGSGAGGPGTGGASSGSGTAGVGGSTANGADVNYAGDGATSHHDAGSAVTGTVAASASGVAATAGIGAVALARKKRVKCVWCGSIVKRKEPVCSHCGVHQECPTCGTPLYKTTLISKGYQGNPQDQGLFCDHCNGFTT